MLQALDITSWTFRYLFFWANSVLLTVQIVNLCLQWYQWSTLKIALQRSICMWNNTKYATLTLLCRVIELSLSSMFHHMSTRWVHSYTDFRLNNYKFFLPDPISSSIIKWWHIEWRLTRLKVHSLIIFIIKSLIEKLFIQWSPSWNKAFTTSTISILTSCWNVFFY